MRFPVVAPEDHVEHELRQRIMDALAHATASSEDGTLSRDELSYFDVGGYRWRLIDRNRGIRNPRTLDATLAIVSSPDGPYGDRELEGGLLRYDYRAGSDAGDNTKLRRAHELSLPIILLRKIEKNVYVPIFPVYVVGDNRVERYFAIALDESLRFLRDPLHPSGDQRRYAERVARQRLHQPEFRARVMRAYEIRCAVCALHHGDLLDAAHIVPDTDAGGLPLISNGLSLCKIHHAAYDRLMLGISPDYQVHINRELLEEIDGPMLRHGLQEMHGRTLIVPTRRADQPDRDRLAQRYDAFRRAG